MGFRSVVVACERRVCGAAADGRPGVDVVLTERAGDGDAVAPVEDVVAVGPLDHGDRR